MSQAFFLSVTGTINFVGGPACFEAHVSVMTYRGVPGMWDCQISQSLSGMRSSNRPALIRHCYCEILLTKERFYIYIKKKSDCGQN